MVTRRFMFTTMLLLMWFWVSAALSQSGEVTSTPPGGSGVAAATKDSKSLPWKFLASPMGLLDPAWTADTIKGFGDPANWDCKKKPQDCTSQKVEQLVKYTVGIELKKLKPTYVVIQWVDYEPKSENSEPEISKPENRL